MSATILDGKATAALIKGELRQIVATMATKPGLGTLLVGDDAKHFKTVASLKWYKGIPKTGSFVF